MWNCIFFVNIRLNSDFVKIVFYHQKTIHWILCKKNGQIVHNNHTWISHTLTNCKFLFFSILHTVKCTRNEDCPLTEACIGNMCQRPCDVHNPCAYNAVCVNVNHGSDCSCPEGLAGNGYVGCQPGLLLYNYIGSRENYCINTCT